MKNIDSGKFRSKSTPYTITSNQVLLSTDLDLAARGLYVLIAHFITIPNFTLYKEHLRYHAGLGTCAFNRLWKQLKTAGYLIQHKLQDDKGMFYYEYELLDQPLPPNPPLEKAPLDDVPSGKSPSINNTLNNNTLNNKSKSIKQQQEQAPVVATLNYNNSLSTSQSYTSSIQDTTALQTHSASIQDTTALQTHSASIQDTTTLQTHSASIQDTTALQTHSASMQLDSDIHTTYKRAFSKSPTAMVTQRLRSYLQRFEKDVVLMALEIAGSNHKAIDYAYGILRVWRNIGAYTLDQVFAYEEGFCFT